MTNNAAVNIVTYSSYRPGWPQTHRDPPASASRILGLKVCATTARLRRSFLSCFLRGGLTGGDGSGCVEVGDPLVTQQADVNIINHDGS